MCISCLWSNRLSKQSLLFLVSFMRSCYRKCHWTKPVPLTMSVGDFTLEQTGPNFHLVFNLQFAYLCHFADWCACDRVCGCPPLTCGAEQGHEVAVPPEYSQSGQTMVPTQLFPWWPQLPWGTAAGTKSFFCLLLPLSARRLQIHLVYLLGSHLACWRGAEPHNLPVALVGQRHHGNNEWESKDHKMLRLIALTVPKSEQGLCLGSRQYHMYQ